VKTVVGFKEFNGKVISRIFLNSKSESIAYQNAVKKGYDVFHTNVPIKEVFKVYFF